MRAPRTGGGRSGYVVTRVPTGEAVSEKWSDVRGTYAELLAEIGSATPELGMPTAREWCGGVDFLDVVDNELGAYLEADRLPALRAVGEMLDLGEVRAAIVHGDFGPHNIGWRDGVAVSVFDWDHSALDDPAIDIAPLIGIYGARHVADIAPADLLQRAMRHRATLPLQVAAAAHRVGDAALRDHAVSNFRSRLAAGTLHDPAGSRPLA
ncbi:MAG: aminoglycoside phosphotransferase family protein [Microbacterium hominis]|nr:aminoglycoside phosphotransferase family protein [Microbacterium hominis]